MIAPPRERVRLEDGLKLDLNRLIRQNLVRPCAAWGSTIRWSYVYSGEEIVSGTITADMTGDQRGWFRLQLGNLDQWRVGEGENVFAHYGARGLLAEATIIGSGGDDGELFDNEPIEMLPLNLLASDEIEHDGIKVRERERTIRAIPCRIVIFRHDDRGKLPPGIADGPSCCDRRRFLFRLANPTRAQTLAKHTNCS